MVRPTTFATPRSSATPPADNHDRSSSTSTSCSITPTAAATARMSSTER